MILVVSVCLFKGEAKYPAMHTPPPPIASQEGLKERSGKKEPGIPLLVGRNVEAQSHGSASWDREGDASGWRIFSS